MSEPIAPDIPAPDPAPVPVQAEFDPLLGEPFASAWASEVAATARAAVHGKLFARTAASRTESQAMVTSRRRRDQIVEVLAPGVQARTLYTAPSDRAQRPGEPLRTRLIELRPGARWRGPEPSCQREWLVLRGRAAFGGDRLEERDYRVAPTGAASTGVRSKSGALLFLRESALPALASDGVVTVRDREAGWPDFAPGVQRRVLWQRNGQAAMLYRAGPGAVVPHHGHGHDEECLMVQGELFLDDVLLQEGDYQLAPAGTGHRVTDTDTGAIVYAHGDLELAFVSCRVPDPSD